MERHLDHARMWPWGWPWGEPPRGSYTCRAHTSGALTGFLFLPCDYKVHVKGTEPSHISGGRVQLGACVPAPYWSGSCASSCGKYPLWDLLLGPKVGVCVGKGDAQGVLEFAGAQGMRCALGDRAAWFLFFGLRDRGLRPCQRESVSVGQTRGLTPPEQECDFTARAHDISDSG